LRGLEYVRCGKASCVYWNRIGSEENGMVLFSIDLKLFAYLSSPTYPLLIPPSHSRLTNHSNSPTCSSLSNSLNLSSVKKS
jgi:hypothetical protein